MLGVIGGSGFCEFSGLQINESKIIQTPFGLPSSAIQIGELNGHPLAFLARHGQPHLIPPHCVNYRANLWALQSIGVTKVIAVNAVGGISRFQEPGVISLPDQIIDYTYARAHTFSDSAEVLLHHIDFSEPYSIALRASLQQAAKKAGVALVAHGVHAVTQGPRLETAAEIRRLANDGADIVGMTGMPEASLARELLLEYASVCLVVNRAAGLTDQAITVESMHLIMQEGMQHIQTLIATYIAL